MKKHLIAAAVAAAVAVPAMAQVSISGNIEAGYTSVDVRAIGSTTTNVKHSSIKGTGAHFGTPGVVFKGSEDLGGGLKAGFTLNREFDTATGLDTRAGFAQSFVSLSGGFGEIQLGTISLATRDAGGVYRFMGDIGRLASNVGTGGTNTNTIQYISPAFNGFTVSLASADADKTVASGADTNTLPASVISYGLRGSIGPVRLSLGNELVKQAAAVGAAQAENDIVTLGARVSLGGVLVGLVVVKQEVTQVGGASGGKRDVTGLHVGYPMGAVTLGASVTNYEVSPAAGGAKPEADITTVGARYALSKRTSLVASFQQVKNSGAANALAAVSTTSVNGGTAGASRGLGVVETTGKTASGYGLSVVHSF